jgi:peptidoglycan/xylan/chitin deacetylase (PgdA/CDA1 family)
MKQMAEDGVSDSDVTLGATQIARWKGDRQGALVLMFDDGCPTHLERVVPALHERGLVGTFYLNPGAKWHDQAGWETVAATTKMEVANHTMHHSGAKDSAQAEEEIASCHRVVLGLHPGRKIPRLVSFIYPGGSPWRVSDEDKAAMIERYHLVLRPPTPGRVGGIHLKTGEELVQAALEALHAPTFGALSFHGVGGDWLSTDWDAFCTLIDMLAEHRDRLWIADPVSVQSYVAERDRSHVEVLCCEPDRIVLALRCGLGTLYDEPLTLVTKVPASWTECVVSQGHAQTVARPADGTVRYQAVPDAAEISLCPGG